MKSLITAAGFFLLLLSAPAQNVILEKDPAIDSLVPSRGPNRKNYVHPYMSFGFTTDPGEAGARSRQGTFGHFQFGVRYKRRLSQTFAVGYEFAYDVNDLSQKQEAGKVAPDTFQYKRERLIFYNGLFSPYLRINFSRRGNQLGKYVDLAAYGAYTFAHVLFQKSDLPDGRVIRSRTTGLTYFQRWNYGATVRIGINKFVLYGHYRLSDLFYSNWNFPEPSRLQVGIQFVLK